MKWHGWKFVGDHKSLHIGPLHGRKQIALFAVDRSGLRTLAYFRSEQDAKDAMKMIDYLTAVLREAGVEVPNE